MTIDGDHAPGDACMKVAYRILVLLRIRRMMHTTRGCHGGETKAYLARGASYDQRHATCMAILGSWSHDQWKTTVLAGFDSSMHG